jgi:hypothetical protein
MEQFILVDGDTVMFLPVFGLAIVTVMPGRITASGGATDLIQGRRACVEGDERSVVVPGCVYFSGAHSIPGVGTLKIDRLAPDQLAQNTRFGGKRALLVGTAMFTARFEVQSAAQMPAPPAGNIPDPMPFYSGQGRFITSNVTRRGT